MKRFMPATYGATRDAMLSNGTWNGVKTVTAVADKQTTQIIIEIPKPTVANTVPVFMTRRLLANSSSLSISLSFFIKELLLCSVGCKLLLL